MNNFIATIGKESTENLEVCLDANCYGITNKGNTANSHAKEAQKGDRLYFWISGSGYDGYATISHVEEVSAETKIPNWSKPKPVEDIPNPWSYLIHFKNYKKLNNRKYFSFVDGVQEITGVKQAWLLQSLIMLPESFGENIFQALTDRKGVEMGEESKEDRYLRMVSVRVPKAVKAIELIGNLGNKSLYEYSDAQKKKVFKYIDDAVLQMKKDLNKQTKESKQDYDFT